MKVDSEDLLHVILRTPASKINGLLMDSMDQ